MTEKKPKKILEKHLSEEQLSKVTGGALLKLCRHCGKGSLTMYAYCDFCGKPITGGDIVEAITCPYCNKLTVPNLKQCQHCARWID